MSGKRPLFLCGQVPVLWGPCLFLCAMLGPVWAAWVGLSCPWAFSTTGLILFVPAHLCPLSECLLSPWYCQALSWARGRHREGGCGLFPQGPTILPFAEPLARPPWAQQIRNSTPCQAQSRRPRLPAPPGEGTRLGRGGRHDQGPGGRTHTPPGWLRRAARSRALTMVVFPWRPLQVEEQRAHGAGGRPQGRVGRVADRGRPRARVACAEAFGLSCRWKEQRH